MIKLMKDILNDENDEFLAKCFGYCNVDIF